MNCILKTSTEFKSLLKETNLHPFVLEVKIAKWQEVNGVNNYPTVEDLLSNNIKPGVEELFDSNPELANQVYEALGFQGNNTKAQEKIKLAYEQLEEARKYVSFEMLNDPEDAEPGDIIYIDDISTEKTQRKKGYATSTYIYVGEELLKKGLRFASTSKLTAENTIWNNLYKLGLATKKESDAATTGFTYEYVGLQPQITPQQKQQALQVYSQYLDSIFPNSKVKDIVYHGTTKGEFEKFITIGSNDNIGRLGAMAGSLQAANMQRGKQEKPEWVRPEEWIEPDLPQGSHLFTLKFNITNPYISKSLDEAMSLDRDSLEKQGYDGVIIEGFEEINGRLKETGFGNEYVVFEPEQIHILGSKQDIEGFREFVNKKENFIINFTDKVFFQKNPLKEFAKKWNIGANGFSMSKLAPDPRMIAEANNLGYGINIASSGSYYISYGGKKINPWSNTYQSKNTSEQKAVNKKLNEDLKLFLNSYGISVNYVDGLDKLGYDAVAIADITNKLILISKGEESWDTLPEEAAHFAFELLGESNPLYIRLMDIIESTDIYKQTFEEYSEDPEYQKNGKPNISKLKKEAIGKAITRNLVDSVSESRGFKATLKLILEKIKSIFGKINRAEFNKEVDKLTLGIAKSMKDGTFKGDVANLAISKAGILKSIKAVSKEEDSLKTAVKALETRLTMSKRTATPLEDVDKLNADIIQIKDMIEDRKAQAGLTIYINNILSELESMIDIIDAYKDEETRESVYLDTKKIKDVSEFLDTHKVAMKKIAILEFDSSFIQRSPDTLKAIKLTNNLMGEIERFFDPILKEKTIEVAEGLKHERSDLDVESALFEATKVDSGWLNLFLGKASNNKDELIRMVKNLLTKIKNRVERYTLDVGKVLLDKQLALEATGFKDFGKFYERDKNGNKTGYIISQYNIGEYQAAKKAYYEALKTRLGVESLDMDKMSTAQKSEFSKALNLWRTEHTQEDPITKKAMPGRRYLNPVYASMDKFQKEYYDALLRRQRDNLSKLPKRYRNDYSEFQLPALRKSVLQRLRSSEQSMWQNFKAIKDETLNVQEEDTQFGTREVYHNELTGDPIKFIPVHYTNMLENPNDLSDDLTGLYVAFTHMAESFQQKSANADKIWMIQKAINERPYIGAKQTKSGSATNIAKMLQNIIDADFYEIQVNKNKYTKKIDSVINYVRRNNLLFNVFTHVANYTVGSVYSKIEDISGKYSTNASKLWAEKTLDGNALGIMADMGARKKLNKVSLLMEHNNVIKDTKRIFSGLNIKNKAGRMLADSGLWATYELADYRIKAKIMLSVYDNYRYFDNKFINRQEYNILNKDKSATEISQGWNSLKDSSLWNMYEAVDGKLVIKPEVNENTKNMIKGIVKQISDQVDGKLSEHDKPELYRHEIGRAILLHRGWLLQGAEARWKSNKLNYETGQYEEGYHRTFVKFMARATGIGANKMGNNINTYGQTIEYEKNLFTGAIKEAFKNMTPEEKSNVAKATADMMFIFLAIIVAGMLKDLGDEDENKDDYTIQFMAYMGQRFKLELTAFSNPFEVFAILSSPSAGLNQIESIFDFVSTIVSFDEEGNWKFTKPGKSGAYTGVPAYEKFIIKRSILKPFYEASSAEAIKSKRTYLENMIMN